MFALEVEYLAGRAVATDRVRRDVAEWPPHPQRLFSALVAAWAECDLGDDARAALEWLERLPPPELRCDAGHRRDVHSAYVPVNDNNAQFKPNKNKGPTIYPVIGEAHAVRRNRQERTFPTVALDDSTAYFVWRDAEGTEQHRPALERIAAEVTCIGHSSSPVRVAVSDASSIEPTLRPAGPGERSTISLRVPSEGRLRTLVEKYELSRQVNRRIEPPEGRFVDYAVARSCGTVAASIFGDQPDWFVFALMSRQPVPLSKALQLTYTVRRTLVRVADEAGALPNEFLTGHHEDGSPIDRPHTAILPLAFVDHRHATGEIKGIAIVLPERHGTRERRGVLQALARLHRIYHGRAFECEVVRQTNPSSGIRTLDPATWIGHRMRPRHRYWVTVTPLIFGHHPGRRFDSAKTVRVIADCCRLIGLPEPRAVCVSEISKHRGVPPASAFDTLGFTGKPSWIDESSRRRLRAHVALEFDEPVAGPIILGAGRYYGMGLFKPWRPPVPHGDT